MRFGARGTAGAAGLVLLLGAARGPHGAARAAAWVAQTTVDGTAPNGELGYAIAVTKDGSAVAVGAPDRPVPTVPGATGGVYVYVRTGSTWTSITGDDPLFDGSNATASGPDYGSAVDIVKVGDVIHLAVGSPQQRTGGPYSGHMVVGDDDQIVGAVWHKQYKSGTWTTPGVVSGNTGGSGDPPDANLNVDDGKRAVSAGFGSSVSLSGNADVVAVGIPRARKTLSSGGGADCRGVVRVFQGATSATPQIVSSSDSGSPAQQDTMYSSGTDDAEFGWSVSLSGDAKLIAIGAPKHRLASGPQVGKLYVFSWNGASGGTTAAPAWTEIVLGARATGSTAGQLLGWDVAISRDGSTVVAGAPGASNNKGEVRVFTGSAEASTFSGIHTFAGTTDAGLAGTSVAVSTDGTYVAYGAPGSSGSDTTGEVLVWMKRGAEAFDEDPTSFFVQYGATLEGVTPAAGEASTFGETVSLSDSATYLAVGAPHKKSADVRNGGSFSVYLSTPDTRDTPVPPPPPFAPPPPMLTGSPPPPPVLTGSPPPPPEVTSSPPPPPEGGLCLWLEKQACNAEQAKGLCVRIPRKPKCVPSPSNGGDCNQFSYAAKKGKGRRKACERAGCVWRERVTEPAGQGKKHCVAPP